MTSEKKQRDWNNGIRWLLVALYAVAIFVFAGQPMSVPGNIIFMGVPLVNFLGWFMTTYIVFQLFALYLSRQQIRQKNSDEMHTRGFWLQPVLIYLFLGCSYIGQYIFQMHNTTAITDLAGNVWNVNNMYETAVTIMVFIMLYSAVLALIHIFSDKGLKK